MFVAWNRFFIRRAGPVYPVVVGEWNLENRRAGRLARKVADPAAREEVLRQGYHTVARIEMDALGYLRRKDSTGITNWRKIMTAPNGAKKMATAWKAGIWSVP